MNKYGIKQCIPIIKAPPADVEIEYLLLVLVRCKWSETAPNIREKERRRNRNHHKDIDNVQ